ncbi:Transposable element Tcb1 transposase [Anthophora retusa]
MDTVQRPKAQFFSPPQSPDLNAIEHVWDYLELKTRKHKVTDKQSLKTALEEGWKKIPSDFTAKLVHSVPRRLKAVLDAKEGPTKY